MRGAPGFAHAEAGECRAICVDISVNWRSVYSRRSQDMKKHVHNILAI